MGTIILEEAKFMWQPNEIREFKELWEQGKSVREIARIMKENPDDIALLAIDQAQKGAIR